MNVIAEIRKKYGMSQDRLAKIAGKSQQQISRWEKANNIPFAELVKISEMLKFDICLEITT